MPEKKKRDRNGAVHKPAGANKREPFAIDCHASSYKIPRELSTGRMQNFRLQLIAIKSIYRSGLEGKSEFFSFDWLFLLPRILLQEIKLSR